SLGLWSWYWSLIGTGSKALWSGKRVRRSDALSLLRVISTCSCRGHLLSVLITCASRMPPGARSPPCLQSSAWFSALTCASCCGGAWSSPPSSSSSPSSDWRPPSKGSRTGPLDLIAQRRTLPHILLYHALARYTCVRDVSPT